METNPHPPSSNSEEISSNITQDITILDNLSREQNDHAELNTIQQKGEIAKRLENLIPTEFSYDIDETLKEVGNLRDLHDEIQKYVTQNFLLSECLITCKFAICALLLRICCLRANPGIELIVSTETKEFLEIEAYFKDVFAFYPNLYSTNIFYIQLQIFKARDSKTDSCEILERTIEKFEQLDSPKYYRALGKLYVEKGIICKHPTSWDKGENLLVECSCVDYFRYYKLVGDQNYKLKALQSIEKKSFDNIDNNTFESFVANLEENRLKKILFTIVE